MFLYNVVDITSSFKVISVTFTKFTNGNSIFIAFGGLLVGFMIAHYYEKMKAVIQGLPAIIFLMIVMGGSLIVSASFISPYIATFIAGALGLILGSLILRHFPMYQPDPNVPSIEESP